MLLPMQTKSEMFGRLLKLPTETVDSIILQRSTDLKNQLFSIIEEFVRQIDPQPTWRVILNALRSPLLKEDRLAMKIENQLFTTRNGMQQCKHSHYMSYL